MMSNLRFRKRLCYSIAACLSLFAVCNHHLHAAHNAKEEIPDHRQVNVTYNAGMLDVTGFPQTQTVAENATFVWSDLDIKASNAILLGWQTHLIPIITSAEVEKMVT